MEEYYRWSVKKNFLKEWTSAGVKTYFLGVVL